jgi:hypothetical protein
MANTILTPSMITRYAIKLFVNTNLFIQNINRDYDDRFAVEGARIGAQLRVRKPNQYTVTDGPGLSVQDTSEQQVVLTVATQRHIDVAFTSVERTLSVEDYQERILFPRISYLTANVANTIMKGSEGGARNISANVDGANNILPITAPPITNARALLVDNSIPPGGASKLALDPHSNSRAATALLGLLNPVAEISRQFRTGQMKNGLSFDMFEDQTVIKHTAGTLVTGTVNGANQTGTSLTVNALGGTLNQGDIVSVAGVNAVNRLTYDTTGTLSQFVVTANVAAGATAIPIYPAIIPPASAVPYAGLPYTAQQYQTVTASPANNAVITPFTNAGVTYRKNIAFVREAISMVTADLWMPPAGKGVIEAARHSMDGVSMRSLVCYEPGTDQPIDRLDTLFGFFYPMPEWLCIVADAVP